ncbi:hypothetical protein P3W85_36240 [Cupriavidus basilensis]|uniref:Uncharacterized protein n=1 Tax=Cupriavidus basilensis TaxID=68895 RepID=A0ABT6B0D3_9BURK|nr:hypothetical protein [Cupriavidus basilensis]MDF3838341.1 hypothetical protein [Cupriavidus basilensis]
MDIGIAAGLSKFGLRIFIRKDRKKKERVAALPGSALPLHSHFYSDCELKFDL